MDFGAKKAMVTMNLGSELDSSLAAAALKKAGGYGITTFTENRPVPRTFTIGISGISDGDDAGALCKMLTSLEGVEKATFDRAKKTATVTVAAKASFSKDAVAAALKKTRFKVTSFKKG